MIKIDFKYSQININQEYKKNKTKIDKTLNNLILKKVNDGKMLNWLDWPNDFFYENDYKKINKYFNEWKKLKIDKYVVIGIGGSFIGIKAAIDMCCNIEIKNKFIFASNISQEELIDNLLTLKNKSWSIIVISKSGNTFETSLNFRFFREALLAKYGKEHKNRIVVISEKKSALANISENNNYKMLELDTNIGGRFSTLTSVGLFVFKLANIDIDKMLDGWSNIIEKFKTKKYDEPIKYALSRYIYLNEKNKQVEVFATNNSKLFFISEHYKQIFSETEGKTNCIIPTIANYSNDLHSIGQLYQEGPTNFFETFLLYKNKKNVLKICNSSFYNDDNLNYLLKNNLFNIEKIMTKAIIKAHAKKANIPCLLITMEDMSEFSFGELIAFLDLSAALSALLLNVNPFNQPGVQVYKSEIKKEL